MAVIILNFYQVNRNKLQCKPCYFEFSITKNNFIISEGSRYMYIMVIKR